MISSILANQEKPPSSLPSRLSTEQVAMVVMLLLFLFRFGHIKIPPRRGSLPLSRSPPANCLALLPPFLSCSFTLRLGFVGVDYAGKTSRQAEASRAQSHLCGDWEGKNGVATGDRGRVSQRRADRQAESLLRRSNTGRMSHPVFQDPPETLLKPVSWRTADVASIDQFPA